MAFELLLMAIIMIAAWQFNDNMSMAKGLPMEIARSDRRTWLPRSSRNTSAFEPGWGGSGSLFPCEIEQSGDFLF
jgi:hypothetical protein